MPRGEKSKLRAREKRRQAREQSKDPVDGQAPLPGEAESPSVPSPTFKDNAQNSPATGTSSNPQVPGGACCTLAAATARLEARVNEGVCSPVEEMADALHSMDLDEHLERSPLEEKVALLVHYLLHKYQKKEPITKADMLRNVIQAYKHHFHEILRKASDHLELLFGLDLKEVDPNRNTYVLINKLELSCDSEEHRGMPMTGLLMTVLGVIFKEGNCATEEEVWRLLNIMGLHAGRKHFFFGDPKKLLTEKFVKEDYLVYRQVPNSDPPRFEFLWGPRAHAETSKMKVLQFVAKIYDTEPSAFPCRYEEALRDDEERARARSIARGRVASLGSARSKAVASSFSCPK